MDLLSKIAYITMIIDHVGKVFFPHDLIFQIIGRIAYPIFAYKISVGVNKSKNIHLFIYRVAIIGLISQYFYMSILKENNLNICFTLALGIILIQITKNYLKHRIIYVIIAIIELTLAINGYIEYGVYGLGLIYIFNEINLMNLEIKSLLYNFIVIAIYTYLCIVFYNWNIVQMYSLMAIPIIIFTDKYNIRNIKISKYIHYLIYPVHLIVIYVFAFIST